MILAAPCVARGIPTRFNRIYPTGRRKSEMVPQRQPHRRRQTQLFRRVEQISAILQTGRSASVTKSSYAASTCREQEILFKKHRGRGRLLFALLCRKKSQAGYEVHCRMPPSFKQADTQANPTAQDSKKTNVGEILSIYCESFGIIQSRPAGRATVKSDCERPRIMNDRRGPILLAPG